MKKIVLLIVILFLVACAENKHEKALNLLNQAKICMQKNEWNEAQIIIDSLHQTYASVVAVRRMADTLSWQIQRLESIRTVAYIDSILPSKTIEFETLKKDFIFTKDTLYQDFGTYVFRSMSVNNNSQRTYLRPMVDERGKLSIVSQYYGEVSVKHHALKISSDQVFYRTKDDGVFNTFDDNGNHAESLFIEGEEALNIANFIADRTQNRVRVLLLGARDYIYYLTETEKQAMLKTLNFSAVVSDCYRLEQEQKKIALKIEKLNMRLH